MQLTCVVLSAGDRPAGIADRATVADIIWAAARPSDAVEHVSVHCDLGSIALGIFTRTPEPADSRSSARALAGRACEMSPLLRDMTIVDTRGLPAAGPLPGEGV
jgi:hypothetical protein